MTEKIILTGLKDLEAYRKTNTGQECGYKGIPLAKQPRFIGFKKDGSYILDWFIGAFLVLTIFTLIFVGLSNV